MLSNHGVGVDVCLSYSKGIFGGLSIEGAVLNPRKAVNAKFYGKEATPKQILFENAVTVPETPETLLPEVYAKLEKLCSGIDIYQPTPEEKKKADSIRELADQEGEEAVKEESVEYVEVENKK